jgi:prepilin-type processing-associated H-X9-DG protein
MEQQNLFDKIPDLEYFNTSNPGDPKNNSIKSAMSAGVLPVKLPMLRCPSDGFARSEPGYSNYQCSMGPQCTNHPWSAPVCDVNPFNKYCDPSGEGLGNWGYAVSAAVGSTPYEHGVRGAFGHFGVPIDMALIRDGASNTIFLGEALPEQNEWYRTPSISGGGAWVGPNAYTKPQWASALSGNALGTTIVPINYVSDQAAGCALNSWQNHNVAWGFRSRHNGGSQFVFGDGAVHFLGESIDMKTYQLLGCRHDAQPVEIP